jgi:hypothetical protein
MWELFFRIERIKAVRNVINNSIATPFHIIIDDTVLSILQTYSRFKENSLVSFNNHISSNTLHSGNITLDHELSEIFRQMIPQFLLIIQREVLVHKWANVEYLVDEEYVGDVFMGDGDKDSVSDSTHHQLINDTMQRFNYSAVLKISRTVGQEDKKRQASHTKKTFADYPRTLATYGRCTRYGGGRVSRRNSMGFARSRSISKLL